MKHSNRGFHFKGFVALADLIFAVSAGLLLLNPVHFDEAAPGDEASADSDPRAVLSQIDLVEKAMPEIERKLQEAQEMAAEYLKNERR